jgi:hypothetical protein
LFAGTLYGIWRKSILKKTIVSVALILELSLSFSCKDGSTITSPFASEVERFRNIPWILTKVDFGDRSLTLNEYEPFHFLFADSIIFGDDGCNSYRGQFVIEDQFMVVSWISHTEIGCSTMRPQLNVCDLIRRWRLAVFDAALVLQSRDTTYTFSSNWTKSVIEYPFTDKHWRLIASNDTAFSFLNSHDLLPKLAITKTREFQFEWYFAPENPAFASNGVNGVFGIGNG